MDFGTTPLSNAYITDPAAPEKTYPLRVMVCHSCWLVQTEDHVQAKEIFNNAYAYFSSMSAGFLKHARTYTDMIVQRLALTEKSSVLEIASNDGYLLKNFVERNIPCLGIEPTESTAKEALKLQVPTVCEFFTEALAKRIGKHDLIIGNNVYAHVPDINDFTNGLREALAPDGTITLEFPHLLEIIEHTQFDTLYHEHFSYLSLSVVCGIFAKNGLRVFDVEQLTVHGGSIRVYGCHHADVRETSYNVYRILVQEWLKGMDRLPVYENFQTKADVAAYMFRRFILLEKRLGKKIAAIGAAAKGNTLLNYAGIDRTMIDFVCDNTPYKIGKYLPGSRIPIVGIEALAHEQPDWLVVLPWNVADEIIDAVRKTGWKKYNVAVAIPQLKLYMRG